MRTTVFGASGGLGSAIVTELAERGHDVIAASRTSETLRLPDGARATATDLRNQQQANRAADGADVVVMAAQVPYSRWAADLRPLVLAALGAARDSGARLVMVDNLYAYGSPGTTITQETEERPTSRKGRLRRAIAHELLSHHRAGHVPVTIGRVSDYFGPGGTNSLLHSVMIGPALAGRTARTYIAADQPHAFTYLPDAARGFAGLVEDPVADGRAWVLPSGPPLTQAEMLSSLEDALREPLRRGHVSRSMMRAMGLFNRDMREALELTDQWDRPYTVDGTAFEATVAAITTTPHEEALAATIDWHRHASASAA